MLLPHSVPFVHLSPPGPAVRLADHTGAHVPVPLLASESQTSVVFANAAAMAGLVASSHPALYVQSFLPSPLAPHGSLSAQSDHSPAWLAATRYAAVGPAYRPHAAHDQRSSAQSSTGPAQRAETCADPPWPRVSCAADDSFAGSARPDCAIAPPGSAATVSDPGKSSVTPRYSV